jgi:HEPN domain-containing protein
MSEAEPNAEVQRWLRYAQEDLIAAESLIGQRTIASRHVCWLAQQAAEKALKAVLVFLQIDFPRRHDLDALRNLIPVDWQLKEAHPDLADLTEWAVEARTPEIGRMPPRKTHVPPSSRLEPCGDQSAVISPVTASRSGMPYDPPQETHRGRVAVGGY